MDQQNGNIEIFNRVCIALFDKLYSSFPIPIDLNTDDVAMSAIPEDASYDESWGTLSISNEVVSFLAEEGFLTYKQRVHSGGYIDVRLTMKGLAVLGFTPAVLEGRETSEPLISKIHSVMHGGLKEAGGELVRQLGSNAFSLTLQAAPTIGSLLVKS